VPGSRPSRCYVPSSVVPQSTSGKPLSRAPSMNAQKVIVSARYHICAARSAGQADIAPRRPVCRLILAHGATEMSRRAVWPADLRRAQPWTISGQFRSSSRKNTIATKQSAVTLCCLRGISANMRLRDAIEGGAIGPPLEGISMRLQLANWQCAADCPARTVHAVRQVWDEILQHRTEGHNSPKWSGGMTPPVNSLEHRAHQRTRE